MELLLTGYKGNDNTSKIVLDLITPKYNVDILYLANDFSMIKQQMEKQLKLKEYDYIFSFGEKQAVKEIHIETSAMVDDQRVATSFPIESLVERFQAGGYNPIISHDAGTYFSNFTYYNGLRMIKDYGLRSKHIFIHLPNKEYMDVMKFAMFFSKVLNEILKEGE